MGNASAFYPSFVGRIGWQDGLSGQRIWIVTVFFVSLRPLLTESTSAMKRTATNETIYGHDVLEFVTVGIEFCAFLEKSQGRPRTDFLDTMLKLLPLLYLKAQMLPRVDTEGDFLPRGKVTEDDYNYIRRIVYDLLEDDDQYLDFAYEYERETDEAHWRSISEHLADIYQPLRNFLAVYQDGIEDCMRDALWAVGDSFELYWGQAVVDALKRLHRLKYKTPEVDDDYDE